MVVFDFDWSLVEENSDTWVLDQLGATEIFKQLKATGMLPWLPATCTQSSFDMKLWTGLLQLALTTKSHQPGEQHQSFCLVRNVENPLGITNLLLDSMSVF